ncbi:YfhO family protein [Chitinophaga filiformis]|uniref:Membrane protein YfhO n=1 Tax=Chitinophaga filiformis TaxID=104663 RepID=A0A1G8D7H9_CHIFI|nr:YfhO family protein [Chitinophaga filiformis]SDH53454.1 membrane protein YfhO [Chitinophaga filiformis]
MITRLNTLLPHALAILGLLVLSVIYCKPALNGKILSQSDNAQWQAMSREAMQFKQTHGVTPLWTTSAFGGMPTYQIAMETPYTFTGYIPAILTFGLPKPIDVLFLSALCFYLLCIVLGTNSWVGFVGAVAYTYASYSPIIIVTGHETKMLALAYLPGVIAGFVLIVRKKYLLGTGIMALFLTYLVGANHLQITYYFFLVLAVVAIVYTVYCIVQKQYKHLIISGLLTILALVLALGSNALTLWTTYEYSKESTRGGTSELTPLPGTSADKSKGGLDREYAFRWSYGKFETFTMLVPDIYGGSSSGALSNSSETYKKLVSMGVPEPSAQEATKHWNLYWGDQSVLGTSGPVYMGAVICLLALLGLFVIRSWHKWWLIAISVLGILLAWGSNFSVFNYFMFDHFPMYNKFRAPSQALIITQLSFAALAALTLQELISGKLSREELQRKLKWTGMIIAGMLLVIYAASFGARFTNATNDAGNPGGDDVFRSRLTQMFAGNTQAADELMTALYVDRQDLYHNDVLRTVIFTGLAFLLLWLFLKNRFNATWLLAGISLLIVVDLLQVDNRYLNAESFIDENSYSQPFQASEADQQILQDKDPYYRVLNLTASPFEDAMTSYFHKSIGGYHAAKLQLYADLIERQISRNNISVLNMLNTKYVIVPGNDGHPVAQRNPDALGNAWFVKHILWAKDADAEMKALDHLDTKDSVVIDQRYKALIKDNPSFDSTATISLIANNLNEISYNSMASTPQFAVFSEVYYEQGWHAFIDEQPAPYCRVDYALRGMQVPAGKHTITFRFEPSSYYTGIKLSVSSYIAMLLLLAGSVVMNVGMNKMNKGKPKSV